MKLKGKQFCNYQKTEKNNCLQVIPSPNHWRGNKKETMKLLDWLFGKPIEKKSIDFRKSTFHPKGQKDFEIDVCASKPQIPSGILNQIIEYDEREILDHIQSMRYKNLQKQEENFEKALAHIDKGNFNAANRLLSKDVVSFYDYYLLGQAEEKNGNISRAAEIYWFNIYHNGTEAFGSFERLMILLRKMNDFQKEYKIAKLYRNFVNVSNFDKIDKRIETITKKMKK